MNTKSKTGGSTTVRHILLCGTAAVLTAILLCMLVSVLVLNEIIPHGAIGGVAIVICFFSVCACAFVCVKVIGEKCIPIAMAVAGVYLLLCFVLKGLFFRSGMGQTVYLIPAALVGAALAALMGAKKRKRRR